MHKRKWLPVLGWALLAASLPGPASVPGVDAADPFEEINKRFQERKSQGDDALLALQNQYRAKREAMEAQWRKREQEIEEQWQRKKREIEQKWDQAQRSTKKEWVDYSPTYDARSIVNFEEGTIEVTALVPVPKASEPVKQEDAAARVETESILKQEAEAARKAAEAAQAERAAAQAEAEAARRAAEAVREAARAAREEKAAALAEAERAKQQAEAAKKETEAAQRERAAALAEAERAKQQAKAAQQEAEAALKKKAIPQAEVEAVPKDGAAAKSAAAKEIAQQLEHVFAERNESGQTVLANQVMTGTGKPVDQQTTKTFVQQEVLPAVVVDEKPVESRDGVTRVKVTAKIKMTPDHLKKRAQQYLDVVRANAQRQQLDPRLVFAVIHTESYFNPKAQSPIPAYGLMQLVPRTAARDAYNFVYKDDKVLDDVYLFEPSQNVELGAAYLHILKNQIFADLAEGEKKNYLLICAYNWGPGNIRKKIVKPFRVQELTEAQVFALLTEKTPEETRNYLKRVTERMALYEELVGR